jgi:hypothetical protein
MGKLVKVRLKKGAIILGEGKYLPKLVGQIVPLFDSFKPLFGQNGDVNTKKRDLGQHFVQMFK